MPTCSTGRRTLKSPFLTARSAWSSTLLSTASPPDCSLGPLPLPLPLLVVRMALCVSFDGLRVEKAGEELGIDRLDQVCVEAGLERAAAILGLTVAGHGDEPSRVTFFLL